MPKGRAVHILLAHMSLLRGDTNGVGRYHKTPKPVSCQPLTSFCMQPNRVVFGRHEAHTVTPHMVLAGWLMQSGYQLLNIVYTPSWIAWLRSGLSSFII